LEHTMGQLLLLQFRVRRARENRVETMNVGYSDLGHRVNAVALKVLHIVQFGKLAAIVGRHVLLKLIERLSGKIGAVDQEEYALRAAELNQTIDAAHRGIGLAAARCHLDQGAWPVLRKGVFQVSDCFDLAVTQPCMRQWWEATQSSAQRGVQFTGHILGSLLKPRR